MHTYAKIVVGVPVEKIFYYALPQEMTDKVTPGVRVIVPFSGRKLTGYVVGLSREKPDVSLREITEVVDPFPIFDGEMLELTRWVSSYYCCTWGEALHTAFPPGIKQRGQTPFSLTPLIHSRGEKHHFVTEVRRNFKEYELTGLTNIYSKEDRKAIGDKGVCPLCPTLLHHTAREDEKTEFYLQAIVQVLKQGRQALLLFPEIFHFQSILGILRTQFGEGIALLHGRLSPKERYRQWLRMRSGAARVVIGTRSAVFAPVRNLGLIIVDEESNSLYKEKRTPKYHAREVALERARISVARVILGTQAPSLESYFQAERGKYKLIVISSEEASKLPEIEIVDLRCNRRRAPWVLSPELREEIEDRLRRREQIVLLLSRRGAGTQKLIDEVGRLFPSARLGSLYSKTAYKETVSLFRRQKTDILIGTQAVLKELSVGRLTLVGIISADTILNIGDFRAAEKMFQFLTQVASYLSGKQGSKVIIQTYNPDHYSILSVKRGGYPQFYREEIEFRRQLNYPPFTSLINIMVADDDTYYKRLIEILEANRQAGVDILPSKISVKRQQITIKGENLAGMRRVIREELSSSKWNKVKVDVDPVDQQIG
jgi:primosomal protein N'